MFRRATLVVTILGAALVAGSTSRVGTLARASNPIHQRFMADPSAHVFNGRVYLYVTDDQGNDEGTAWNSKEWRAYSSGDLVNWTDHGAVFAVSDEAQGVPRFGWGRDFAWAPAAISRNGYYYLYLPVDGPFAGQSKIGVARSTSPTSGFCDARGGNPLVDERRDHPKAGTEVIDPMVFEDDDPAQTAYLYYGGRGDKRSELKAVRLQPDMIHLQGDIETLPADNYGEAPWVHKRNGIYYLSYSTGWPGQIAYSTAPGPLGPFTYRGIVLDYVNVNTNHHSIVQYRDQWYLFYHQNSRAGGGHCRRSVHIDCLFYGPDGAIRPVERTALGVVAGGCGSAPSTVPNQPSSAVPTYRMQSYNFQTRFIRHAYYRAQIDANVSPVQDEQFIVGPGLSDCSGVSFESVNFPGHFLRHTYREVWLAEHDGSALFSDDATWYRRSGFSDSQWSSYEAFNLEGEFMRHFNYRMIVGPVTDDPTLRADATFRELANPR